MQVHGLWIVTGDEDFIRHISTFTFVICHDIRFRISTKLSIFCGSLKLLAEVMTQKILKKYEDDDDDDDDDDTTDTLSDSTT